MSGPLPITIPPRCWISACTLAQLVVSEFGRACASAASAIVDEGEWETKSTHVPASRDPTPQ